MNFQGEYKDNHSRITNYEDILYWYVSKLENFLIMTSISLKELKNALNAPGLLNFEFLFQLNNEGLLI